VGNSIAENTAVIYYEEKEMKAYATIGKMVITKTSKDDALVCIRSLDNK